MSSQDLILRVLEGESVRSIVQDIIEKKQKPYKVSKEYKQRALDRIANLERRGVDVEDGTLRRLAACTNPGKVHGIYLAAKELGLSRVAKEAAKKFKRIVGQSVKKF